MLHYVLHRFRPSETVDAIIRLRGRHNYTQEEVLVMRERFNELNGARVPRSGEVFKIPVEPHAVDDYGNLVDVTVLVDSFLVDAPVVPDPGRDGEQPAKAEHAGDPGQPVHELPTAPSSSSDPQGASKDDWDQQVSPHPGKQEGQEVKELYVEQPTLVVSGARRRPK